MTTEHTHTEQEEAPEAQPAKETAIHVPTSIWNRGGLAREALLIREVRIGVRDALKASGRLPEFTREQGAAILDKELSKYPESVK